MNNPETKFNPNKLTFEQGLERIEKAVKAEGLDTKKIVTSRDAKASKLREVLMTKNVPGGFMKWQLPVALQCQSQMFISVGAPNTKVPKHSHDDGPGLRFIGAGSILYNGKELTAGDWMYIPKGEPYSFEVGPLGATMFYCYCCCCA